MQGISTAVPVLAAVVSTTMGAGVGCGTCDQDAPIPVGRGEETRWADTTQHGDEVTIELTGLEPDAGPDEHHLAEAMAFIAATRTASEPYQDYEWTRAGGGFTVANVEVLDQENAVEWHVFNPDYLRDDETLNPTKPESLMYRFDDEGRATLIGVMFMMPPGVPGRQVAGPLTKWHYHPTVEFCIDPWGVPTRKAPRGNEPGGGCPEGETNGPLPEMMHVWLVPNAMGVFSHMMAVPPGSAGAAEQAEHGGH